MDQSFRILPGERGLNLRRRGWGAVRRANNRWGIGVNDGASFAFPADAAVLCIFKDYTTFRKLFADAVGGREVALLACGLTLGDQRFDLGSIVGRCRRAVTQRAQLFRVVILRMRSEAAKSRFWRAA